MSHRLQVLVPEELDAEIRKKAQRARVSKGEWVRRVIMQALRDQPAALDPVRQLMALDAPTGEIDEIIEQIGSGRL